MSVSDDSEHGRSCKFNLSNLFGRNNQINIDGDDGRGEGGAMGKGETEKGKGGNFLVFFQPEPETTCRIRRISIFNFSSLRSRDFFPLIFIFNLFTLFGKTTQHSYLFSILRFFFLFFHDCKFARFLFFIFFLIKIFFLLFISFWLSLIEFHKTFLR